MENNLDILGVLIEEGCQNPEGITALKIKDKPNYYIWLWRAKKIEVYETPSFNLKGCSTWDDKLAKHEINLSCNVIDVFQLDQDSIYVLNVEGVILSYQIVIHNASSSEKFMEVEDLFSSPTSCDTSKWKETTVMKIRNCDYVVGTCHSSSTFAALVVKDHCLAIHVYSYPDFTFKFCFDIHKYNSQSAVLTCCETASLSPSLKLYFQDNLEILDSEIIIVGLSSGLILWFSANNMTKEPYVLFSVHDVVMGMHFVEDKSNGLLSHLIIVMNSGSIVIIGHEKAVTKFVPDSVKVSCCISNHLITSNLVDCYNIELKMSETTDINSVLLPVKGVSALSKTCDKNTLLAATVHGTVYCLDINVASLETSTCFTIPEEHMIDTMMTQAKNLDNIYKQLAEEDCILKAVSTAITANSLQLFNLTLNVISDNEFYLVTKLTKAGVVFSSKLWLANVDVTRKQGHKNVLRTKFTQDFSCDSELRLNVKQSLSIGDVVSLELMLLLKSRQPILIVPVDKVEIDAGYLMVTHVLVPNVISREESFEEIISNLNCELPSTKKRLQEWKLCLKIPDKCILNSVLTSILVNSQQRIPKDEWDKLVGGKKHSTHINIHSQAVMLNLDMESRELSITSCDIQSCYQIKDAILKRLQTSEEKYISENVALEVQALKQEFEIESFKEENDFQTLEIIRKKLRSTLSCHFLL